MRAIIATAALLLGTGAGFAALAQSTTPRTATVQTTNRASAHTTVQPVPTGATMAAAGALRTTTPQPVPMGATGTSLDTDLHATGRASARITGNSVSAQTGATGAAAGALGSTGMPSPDPLAPAMAGAGVGPGR